MPVTPEIGKSEATVYFQKELDQKLEQLYPRIKRRGDQNYQRFINGEIALCSFKILDVGDRDLLRKLLLVSLERAANPEDNIVYSAHGAEHGTFEEAIGTLKKAINSGNYSIWNQRQEREFELNTGKSPLRFYRTIVDSGKFERGSFRPAPHIEAIGIKSQFKNPDLRKKRLRKLALEHSLAYSLLVATYMGLDIDDILSLFDNKDVRVNIQSAHRRKVPIPHHGLKDEQLREQIRNLKVLAKSLIVDTSQGRFPSFSSDSFRQAVSLLFSKNYLTEKEFRERVSDFSFVPTKDLALARAVFMSMHEVAQMAANPAYLDPARTEYIDRVYEGVATSRVITAFIQTLEIHPKNKL